MINLKSSSRRSMELLALATLEAKRRKIDPQAVIQQQMMRQTQAHLYTPAGSLRMLFESKDAEVLVSGPAGTGKSRACLERVIALARQYPMSRVLILRKTRESLTEAALVTLEQHVLGMNHPVVVNGPQRRNRQSYALENGSQIVVGGLDKPSKVMSTEYDLIYIQEAIELAENDWESVTTRLRNGRMPFQQLLADTNPDKPTHWLRRRCDAGKTHMIDSRHEDNPTLFDAAKRAYTKRGVEYISKLDNLTGARHDRLRWGKWVQSEGVVYADFDAAVHVIDRFDIPREWRRFRSIDFGYTNPFVCQWWAVDPDGRMYLYREIYQTQALVEHLAALITELSRDEQIETSISDHDAEDRATLNYRGIGTQAADKAVTVGIQAVQSRLKKAGDGKPRLFALRDSLVQPDAALDEAKKPLSTLQEFDSYMWPKEATGKAEGEAPVKLFDHGMDAMRYAVMYADKYSGSIFL